MAMRFIPKRRWFQWSLRTLFVVVAVAALLPWIAVNLNWMHERSVMVDSNQLPLEGERRAPWPLWVLGARGFARIQAKVPPEKVAGVQEAARERKIHYQRIFPEAEAIVTSNAE
jgi:hypothetical protein